MCFSQRIISEINPELIVTALDNTVVLAENALLRFDTSPALSLSLSYKLIAELDSKRVFACYYYLSFDTRHSNRILFVAVTAEQQVSR